MTSTLHPFFVNYSITESKHSHKEKDFVNFLKKVVKLTTLIIFGRKNLIFKELKTVFYLQKEERKDIFLSLPIAFIQVR